MSVLENFSRMLLASILSEKQDTAAYLRVLAIALRNYGARSGPLSLMEEEYSTRCVLWLFTRPWTSAKNGSIPGNPGKLH